MLKKAPPPRNIMAKAVRTPLYKMRVVRNKKKYTRKGREQSLPSSFILYLSF